MQTLTPPAQTMTWEKFQRTVLPTAQTIEFYAPCNRESYVALVTAADPDAPLIFQWDNPVSLYVYSGGSTAGAWNLTAGHYHKATGITFRPSMWSGEMKHQHTGVIFILEGAKDGNAQHCGLALFPETLRAEFHPIRATIEAFSRAGMITDADIASACGVLLGKGNTWSARLRVTSNEMVAEYQLDRWD